MIDKDTLRLDLDSLYEDGYFYTAFDVGGEGHAITIDTDNKEKFLDTFALELRRRAEKLLKHPEIDDEYKCGQEKE